MKLTVGKKLYIGFGAIVAIIVVIVLNNTQELADLRKLQDEGAARAVVANEAQQAKQVGYKLYSIIADAQLNGFNDELNANFNDSEKECEDILARIEKDSDTEKEKEWSASAKGYISDGVKIFKNQMIPLFTSRGKAETDSKISHLNKMIDSAFAKARIPLEEYSESIEAESNDANKLFHATAKNIVHSNMVLAGIAIFLAIFIAFFITRGITRSLNNVVGIIQQIARGNLTVTFDTKSLSNTDETGILTRSMKEMSEKLNETISFALDASENVSSGSSQLSSASQGISQGSSEQAASIEEVSASVEEVSSSVEEISASLEQVSASIEQMTASINQNSENANQTEKIAMKSSIDAKEGGEAVQQTVSAMKQIADKISIIQEIARQTNLLSLNASIEAARAGEHGKGFAVVASAVQKLAERSQDAAEEISKLSKSSVDVAEKAGEKLDKLVPDIGKTAELVAEINAASSEQNSGIQQVNTAIQQVNSAVQQVNSAVQQVSSAIQQSNQVVQSNASASEELASTSEELSSQAEELKNRISFFQIDRGIISHKSDTFKARNHQTFIPKTHVVQHPVMSNLHKGKQFAKSEDSTLEQKTGIAIDMKDDDDSNFQRI
jgi:methyl-accepting chemotaxis protein